MTLAINLIKVDSIQIYINWRNLYDGGAPSASYGTSHHVASVRHPTPHPFNIIIPHPQSPRKFSTDSLKLRNPSFTTSTRLSALNTILSSNHKMVEKKEAVYLSTPLSFVSWDRLLTFWGIGVNSSIGGSRMVFWWILTSCSPVLVVQVSYLCC